MPNTNVSLHLAILNNLNTRELTAVKADKIEEITSAALDVSMPSEELGVRLSACVPHDATGLAQLRSTLGLSQLISENPTYIEFAEARLPRYQTAISELGPEPNAVRQITELMLEDIKEIAIDSQVLGIGTVGGPGAGLWRQIDWYRRRGQWQMARALYKTWLAIQNTLKLPGTLSYRVKRMPAPPVRSEEHNV